MGSIFSRDSNAERQEEGTDSDRSCAQPENMSLDPIEEWSEFRWVVSCQMNAFLLPELSSMIMDYAFPFLARSEYHNHKWKPSTHMDPSHYQLVPGDVLVLLRGMEAKQSHALTDSEWALVPWKLSESSLLVRQDIQTRTIRFYTVTLRTLVFESVVISIPARVRTIGERQGESIPLLCQDYSLWCCDPKSGRVHLAYRFPCWEKYSLPCSLWHSMCFHLHLQDSLRDPVTSTVRIVFCFQHETASGLVTICLDVDTDPLAE